MVRDGQVLGSVPLFAGLSADRVARLVDRSVVRTVCAGEVVALRGQRCSHLVIVESGVLTAVRDTSDGRRMRLGEYAAPCAVDKAAVLDEGGHTATWVAARPSRLRLVPVAEVHAAIDDVPTVRRHVLSLISRANCETARTTWSWPVSPTRSHVPRRG